jgi:hypothetical protein
MGRFFFHLSRGDAVIPDDEGSDLPDVSSAVREAQLVACDLIADALRSGKDEVPSAVIIADEAGRSIGTVALSTVLPRSLRL